MVFREITYPGILVRIFCAVVVGGIIGMERGMKTRPAGLRTYMLSAPAMFFIVFFLLVPLAYCLYCSLWRCDYMHFTKYVESTP